MLKDITLGQYFPGRSIIHRLDPRIKLITMIVYIVALLLAGCVVSYALSAGFVAAAIAVSGIKPKLILKSLKAIIFIVLFTAVLNMLYTPGDVLVSFWIIRITKQGIFTGFGMGLRVILLVTISALLTYTTSPMALTDGLENLLSPLKKIHIPVHEFAMMMTIALRFIPTLIEETDKIMSAQKARGADFESGNIIKRAKALIPVLIPLFVSSFRRADELATAMECRLYHGGNGRTRLNSLRYGKIDAVGGVVILLVCAAIIVVSKVFGL
ncbi:MAG: energy-coupling factor transporter transmembrane protein EcfT [Clostridia bacterium]|nr:energy-coupling factor transporter transmembrane protein EcfT [Clostridia bacterium]